MTKHRKTLERILHGTADRSVRFRDLTALLKKLGFDQRVRGDHHIFTRDGIEEIINLQAKGSLSKAYQVKQVRQLILKYRLGDVP